MKVMVRFRVNMKVRMRVRVPGKATEFSRLALELGFGPGLGPG